MRALYVCECESACVHAYMCVHVKGLKTPRLCEHKALVTWVFKLLQHYARGSESLAVRGDILSIWCLIWECARLERQRVSIWA